MHSGATPLLRGCSRKNIFCQKIFDNFFSFQATEMVLTSKWGRIQQEILIWPDQVVAASWTLVRSPKHAGKMLIQLRTLLNPRGLQCIGLGINFIWYRSRWDLTWGEGDTHWIWRLLILPSKSSLWCKRVSEVARAVHQGVVINYPIKIQLWLPLITSTGRHVSNVWHITITFLNIYSERANALCLHSTSCLLIIKVKFNSTSGYIWCLVYV